MIKREAAYLAGLAGSMGLLAAALVVAGPGGQGTRGSVSDDGGPGRVTGSFVNFETAHVHPIDMTPDGTRLLVVNTPDARLEVFDLTGPLPVLVSEIPVGIEGAKGGRQA